MQIAFLSVIDSRKENEPDLDVLLRSGYRYALALTHDPAEAEDLLQDACVAIARRGARWEKSYLFTTIRNRFIDRYRRNRKILFVPLEPGDSEQISAEAEWEMPDVLQSETLSRALGSLRVDERELLFLAFVEGYTAQQISDLTRRPRNTILSLLHRGKAKLRRMLARQTRKEVS